MDFTGSVALVTGAGNGLGRAYAHEFARRGAKVLVNDIAVGADGRATGESPAQRVVTEIEEAGGVAVANGASVATVEGGAAAVACAIESFGDLDIVVNNAGIALPTTSPTSSTTTCSRRSACTCWARSTYSCRRGGTSPRAAAAGW